MKKLLLSIAVLFMFVATGFAQTPENPVSPMFKKYQDSPQFTNVFVSPKMFEMVAKIAKEKVDEEIVDLVSNLKGLWVLTTEETPNAYYQEAIKSVNTSKYDLLMSVKDDEENVRFWTKDSNGGDIVDELLLLVGGEDEFVMVSFIGSLDLNTLARIAAEIEIDGLDKLELLEKDHDHDHDDEH